MGAKARDGPESGGQGGHRAQHQIIDADGRERGGRVTMRVRQIHPRFIGTTELKERRGTHGMLDAGMGFGGDPCTLRRRSEDLVGELQRLAESVRGMKEPEHLDQVRRSAGRM